MGNGQFSLKMLISKVNILFLNKKWTKESIKTSFKKLVDNHGEEIVHSSWLRKKWIWRIK